MSSSGAKAIIGNLVLVGNSLCAAVYFLLMKPLYGRYSSEMITATSYVVAAVALLITCSPLVGKPVWGLGGGTGVGALLYAALMCSALGYQLMTWGNKYLDASISACYVMLQPVASCIAAYFALAEPVTLLDIAGSLLALVGLCAVGSDNSAQPACDETPADCEQNATVRCGMSDSLVSDQPVFARQCSDSDASEVNSPAKTARARDNDARWEKPT